MDGWLGGGSGGMYVCEHTHGWVHGWLGGGCGAQSSRTTTRLNMVSSFYLFMILKTTLLGKLTDVIAAATSTVYITSLEICFVFTNLN